MGTLYFKLSKKDKKKAKRPVHPHDPYVRLRKGTKVWYKKRSELTEEDKLLLPPPPPVPDASKEETLKAYKAWKKRTGNDIPPPPPPKKATNNKNDFKIELKKTGNKVSLKCIKGCKWEKLSFTLNENQPKLVNHKGLNKVNARNTGGTFHFIMMKDEGVFDLKSFKNSKWKGLSSSSKDKLNLLITNETVKTI